MQQRRQSCRLPMEIVLAQCQKCATKGLELSSQKGQLYRVVFCLACRSAGCRLLWMLDHAKGMIGGSAAFTASAKLRQTCTFSESVYLQSSALCVCCAASHQACQASTSMLLDHPGCFERIVLSWMKEFPFPLKFFLARNKGRTLQKPGFPCSSFVSANQTERNTRPSWACLWCRGGPQGWDRPGWASPPEVEPFWPSCCDGRNGCKASLHVLIAHSWAQYRPRLLRPACICQTLSWRQSLLCDSLLEGQQV